VNRKRRVLLQGPTLLPILPMKLLLRMTMRWKERAKKRKEREKKRRERGRRNK
jgi:hypothetical protein